MSVMLSLHHQPFNKTAPHPTYPPSAHRAYDALPHSSPPYCHDEPATLGIVTSERAGAWLIKAEKASRTCRNGEHCGHTTLDCSSPEDFGLFAFAITIFWHKCPWAASTHIDHLYGKHLTATDNGKPDRH
jgi:hypothetical protein